MPRRTVDPVVAHNRAKKARAAQSTPDYFITKLVDAAPELTAAQRVKLASILAAPCGGGAA